MARSHHALGCYYLRMLDINYEACGEGMFKHIDFQYFGCHVFNFNFSWWLMYTENKPSLQVIEDG